MDIDHTQPEAICSRVIASLEHLHRGLDRSADNPGLRDGAAVADANRRLARLAGELSDLTGMAHDHLLPDPERCTVGELFLGSSELLATARSAVWWHGQTVEQGAGLQAGSAAYL